jgi:hypothetical protein
MIEPTNDNLIERVNRLKQFRRIATRYENRQSFRLRYHCSRKASD